MASAKSYEQKLYLDDPLLCETTSSLLSLEILQDSPLSKYGEFKLIFSRTIFHPQGGGQPSDVGYISTIHDSDDENQEIATTKCVFQVNHVQYNPMTENIEHVGSILTGNYEIFQSFLQKNLKLEINSEKRRISRRLHSFGHLIDAAIQRIGYWNQLTVGKGYHFPDGPYVEYQIISDDFLRELDDPKNNQKLFDLLTIEIQNLIAGGMESRFVVIPEEEANALLAAETASSPPPHIAPVPALGENCRLVRVVTIAGSSCPCGGTHVQNTIELNGLQITKIKKKKKTLKISYGEREGGDDLPYTS
jgi:Ser-tRNA(Ala) deacylase AlaX